MQQLSPLKSEAVLRRLAAVTGAVKHEVRQKRTRVPVSRVNGSGSIRAVISSDDKAVESAKSNKVVSERSGLSSSDKKRGRDIDVRAVITIRKKMKEKINEKIEDQWEYFLNGIGQGILIQLISEEIDPG